AFGSLPDTSIVEITLSVNTGIDPLEILFDDLYLYDDPAPLLDNVVLTPNTPEYDQTVIVDLEVKEQDLDMLELGYQIDLGTWTFISMAHHSGEIYRATIPAQAYNTRVDYFFRANDTWGMYSELPGGAATFNYIVADLTDPDVSIDHPSTGTEVIGTVDIDVSATDEASGMDRVEFSVDGSMVSSDSSAPYSYAWDSTSVADGSVTITVTAYDNDGNQATDSITLTVNNGGTLPPPPPIPGFPLEAIILGVIATLGVIVVIRRRRHPR
ncbi:MAG: Loki-CTERM sorting domain-containing protein, partial [Promethearchaeota archaeon]